MNLSRLGLLLAVLLSSSTEAIAAGSDGLHLRHVPTGLSSAPFPTVRREDTPGTALRRRRVLVEGRRLTVGHEIKVTSTGEFGPGTLEEAISRHNSPDPSGTPPTPILTAGEVRLITFDLASGSDHTILRNSDVNIIAPDLVIDGIGHSGGQIIVEGHWPSPYAHYDFIIASAAENTIIRGITLRRFPNIFTEAPNVLFSHCHIRDYHDGASISSAAGSITIQNPSAAGTAVEYCEIENVDDGIVVDGVEDVTIYRNHIYSNEVDGVRFKNGGKATISQNSIHSNGLSSGDKNIIWDSGQPANIAPIIVANPTCTDPGTGYVVSMVVEVPGLPTTYLPATYIIEAFSHAGSASVSQLSTYQGSKSIVGSSSTQQTTMILPCLDAEYVTLTGTVVPDAGKSETVPMFGASIQLSDTNCQCSTKHPTCPQFCSAIGASGDCPDLTVDENNCGACGYVCPAPQDPSLEAVCASSGCEYQPLGAGGGGGGQGPIFLDFSANGNGSGSAHKIAFEWDIGGNTAGDIAVEALDPACLNTFNGVLVGDIAATTGNPVTAQNHPQNTPLPGYFDISSIEQHLDAAGSTEFCTCATLSTAQQGPVERKCVLVHLTASTEEGFVVSAKNTDDSAIDQEAVEQNTSLDAYLSTDAGVAENTNKIYGLGETIYFTLEPSVAGLNIQDVELYLTSTTRTDDALIEYTPGGVPPIPASGSGDLNDVDPHVIEHVVTASKVTIGYPVLQEDLLGVQPKELATIVFAGNIKQDIVTVRRLHGGASNDGRSLLDGATLDVDTLPFRVVIHARVAGDQRVSGAAAGGIAAGLAVGFVALFALVAYKMRPKPQVLPHHPGAKTLETSTAGSTAGDGGSHVGVAAEVIDWNLIDLKISVNEGNMRI